jgi:hypothetical protein
MKYSYVWQIIFVFIFAISILVINPNLPVYLQIPYFATVLFFVPFPLGDYPKALKDVFFLRIKSVFLRWLLYVSLVGLIGLLMSTVKLFLPDNWLGSLLNAGVTIIMIIFAFVFIHYFSQYFKSQ